MQDELCKELADAFGFTNVGAWRNNDLPGSRNSAESTAVQHQADDRLGRSRSQIARSSQGGLGIATGNFYAYIYMCISTFVTRGYDAGIARTNGMACCRNDLWDLCFFWLIHRLEMILIICLWACSCPLAADMHIVCVPIENKLQA